MPGKVMKKIGKTLHADGYYIASIISSTTSHEAFDEVEATPPKIKLWFRFDKGLIIGPEEREKLIREEAKEEIPTPGFVLLADEEVEEPKTTTTTTTATVTHSHADLTFQSKLEVTKRKMHDSYQQLANAKKQRRIQVIDHRDLSPPTDQSLSKGKGAVNVAARKKMITTNRKTKNFLDGGRGSKLMKPTSIF